MAVALAAPAHPGSSRPSFELLDGEVELGVGIHGERGVARASFASADELAASLTAPVADDLRLATGDQVIAIVNGLGATHPIELSVVFGAAARLLEGRGVQVAAHSLARTSPRSTWPAARSRSRARMPRSSSCGTRPFARQG